MIYEIYKFIFYFFGIIAINYEIWSIKNYEKNLTLSAKAKASIKDKSIEFSPKELTYGCLQYLYCLWAIIGIFSSQWLMFLLLFTLSFVKYIFKGLKTPTWCTFDSVLSIVFILFAILNTYHFHIGWKEFLELYK